MAGRTIRHDRRGADRHPRRPDCRSDQPGIGAAALCQLSRSRRSSTLPRKTSAAANEDLSLRAMLLTTRAAGSRYPPGRKTQAQRPANLTPQSPMRRSRAKPTQAPPSRSASRRQARHHRCSPSPMIGAAKDTDATPTDHHRCSKPSGWPRRTRSPRPRIHRGPLNSRPLRNYERPVLQNNEGAVQAPPPEAFPDRMDSRARPLAHRGCAGHAAANGGIPTTRTSSRATGRSWGPMTGSWT